MFVNIKKLYKSAVKCDDQRQYKIIIEAAVFYTSGGLTNNSTMAMGASDTQNNPIKRKYIGPFLELLCVKQKNWYPLIGIR